MERQAIERLAMDVALGELNEDAAALLDAYLASHPEARPWAQQMKTVCARTQNAIDLKTRRNDTSICVPAAGGRRWTSIRWAGPLRWAAVVTISLLLGAAIGRRTETHETPSGPSVVIETTRDVGPRSWQEILAEPDKGFWGAKAAAMLHSKSYRGTSSQPSLWQTLRQLQKGHDHEPSRQ
jgi:hypothetical protein